MSTTKVIKRKVSTVFKHKADNGTVFTGKQLKDTRKKDN